MALSRFVLTATVTLPPGAYTPDDVLTAGTPAAGSSGSPANFGTGSYAQSASHWGSGAGNGVASGSTGTVFPAGTVIYADSSGTGGAGALYTAIGAGNLRAFVDGRDGVGHAALSNLGEHVMLQQPAVPATSPAGLTNFVTNTTGNTAFVTVGANGATMANYWVNAVSVATTATAFMMSVPPGGTCALQYTVAVPVWFWSECTPVLPASTVATLNTTGRDISVVFTGGGSVSAITINGLTTNIIQAPGMQPAAAYTQGIPLTAGATIAVTYTGTVAWSWLDPLTMISLGHSDATNYAAANTVAPTGTAGFSPLNTLPYAVHAATGTTGYGTGIAN